MKILVAAVFGVLFLATGCGGSDESGSPPSGSAAVTTGLPRTPEVAEATTSTGMPRSTAVTTTTTAPPRQSTAFGGFNEIAYRVQGMPAAQRCALLAETAEQRARGLMNRTDLGGYDGMLFVFEGDTTGTFWMKNTPLTLSIAWFDAHGRFVSSTDMEPCLTSAVCPSYAAAGPYRYALEVPQGGLGPLGIGPGATLSIGGTCA